VARVNVELTGLEDLVRQVVREEVAAALALEQRSDWLDSKAAAEYLGLSVGRLHNLRGEVPSHKVGGRRRYRRSELDAYQANGQP
jgi:excisionase family DNA binding protein